MRESLKCRGFWESRLSVRNDVTLACAAFRQDLQHIRSRPKNGVAKIGHTLIASSQGSVGSGGMPQSGTPGIGGGRSSLRICASSSSGASAGDGSSTSISEAGSTGGGWEEGPESS